MKRPKPPRSKRRNRGSAKRLWNKTERARARQDMTHGRVPRAGRWMGGARGRAKNDPLLDETELP